MSIVPNDDEPQNWRELAEACLADMERYAGDETSARMMVSYKGYRERFELLARAPGLERSESNGATEGSHTPSGIRVKELKWQQTLLTVWHSDLGGYQIDKLYPKSFDAFRAGHNVGGFPTLEEAKAACQSDFQRRITECLEGETPNLALAHAARNLLKNANGHYMHAEDRYVLEGLLNDLDRTDCIPHTVDATGWRGISTAPKDGTVFIAWETDPRESHGLDAGVYQCAWRKGDWRGPEGEQRRPTHWAPLPPPPGEEGESERERIAHELREHADKQGDPSGWLEVIAIAIETDWSVINDPENFKNEPCRFAVMQERDALQARCDELEAALSDILPVYIEMVEECGHDPSVGIDCSKDFARIERAQEALRSVVNGGE